MMSDPAATEVYNDIKQRLRQKLEASRIEVHAGDDVTPRWRVLCADGDQILLTPWETADQVPSRLALVRNFILWKQLGGLVRGFISSSETIESNGIVAQYCDRQGGLAIFQGICRSGRDISFGALQTVDYGPSRLDMLSSARDVLLAGQRAEAEQIYWPEGRFVEIAEVRRDRRDALSTTASPARAQLAPRPLSVTVTGRFHRRVNGEKVT